MFRASVRSKISLRVVDLHLDKALSEVGGEAHEGIVAHVEVRDVAQSRERNGKMRDGVLGDTQ